MDRKSFKRVAGFALVASLAACGGGGGGGGNDGGGTEPPPPPPPPATDARSFQQYAFDVGTLEFAEVNPAISGATYAATAPEAVTAAGSSAELVGLLKSRSTTPAATGVSADAIWPNDAFVPTAYIGAVDPAGPAWARGWTIHGGTGSLYPGDPHPLADDVADGTIAPAGDTSCPLGTYIGDASGGIADGFPICNVTQATLLTDTTLTNDYVYLFSTALEVGDGGAAGATVATATAVDLTIEAGTQIYGDTTSAAAGIIITRGSRIFVEGTADLPVVMSSADSGVIGGSDNFTGRNEWGGLIIDGFAPVNEGAEVQSEAAPTGVSRFFGGSDPVDDSGAISYVVITESGQEFRLDEEVQGLTLEGVGAGTSISYVQIHHSGDDGIEAFGGTVGMDHLVMTGVNDDALDLDLGYQGLIQFVLIRQASDNGDRGIESDNNGDNFSATPITMPVVVNLTILGSTGNDGTSVGVLHREGMSGFFAKSIITDADVAGGEALGRGCIDIDDSDAATDAGRLRWIDSIGFCDAGLLSADDEDRIPAS